jgi:aspartate aminotransferase-like enzyme
MPGLLPNVDPDGLLEFSVVYTDRSLNHMSNEFKRVITDISGVLKDVYQAHSTVVIPGSGTYGMEAVARQFATNQKCLVIRNGWFSYRWTQIFEAGQISKDLHVIKARRNADSATAPFAPAPIDEIVNFIKTEKPAVVLSTQRV